MKDKSDKDLILKLKNDDMLAFDCLYKRYFRKLFGFVLRYIKQEDVAEEIVQEVFIKIWECRYKINVFTSFESFLFTIAYNSTISILRKKVNEKKYIDQLRIRQQIIQAPDVIDEIHKKAKDYLDKYGDEGKYTEFAKRVAG